ncbi:MAG: hypothetical protein A2Z96_03600 [Spirochaetes bacterium GWB1_48_6]|nr:MAG: hypothetical protein A2Z96_03600 [Spirochaetes bacterium GWB1_48_6]
MYTSRSSSMETGVWGIGFLFISTTPCWGSGMSDVPEEGWEETHTSLYSLDPSRFNHDVVRGMSEDIMQLWIIWNE